MEKEVTVKVAKKDKSGFLGTDEQWYSNKFKTFEEVSKGDKVRAYLNEKGFLENLEILEKSKIQEKPKNEAIEKASIEKQASVILSYCKDLVIADKIKMEDIAEKAKGFMSLLKELSSPEKPKIERPDLQDPPEEALI